MSDLHMLRYFHLATTSHQMPKKMKDQVEEFAVSSKERENSKVTIL